LISRLLRQIICIEWVGRVEQDRLEPQFRLYRQLLRYPVSERRYIFLFNRISDHIHRVSQNDFNCSQQVSEIDEQEFLSKIEQEIGSRIEERKIPGPWDPQKFPDKLMSDVTISNERLREAAEEQVSTHNLAEIFAFLKYFFDSLFIFILFFNLFCPPLIVYAIE
jgi:hypothetical protein